MTDKIEPALSATQWEQRFLHVQAEEYDSDRNAAAEIHVSPGCLHLTEHEHSRFAIFDTPPMLAALIALANAALPDSGPRKITREWIGALRLFADDAEREVAALFTAVGQRDSRRTRSVEVARAAADALESYLPLEGT